MPSDTDYSKGSFADPIEMVTVNGRILVEKGLTESARRAALQARNLRFFQEGETPKQLALQKARLYDSLILHFEVPKILMDYKDEGLDRDTPLKIYLDECIARQLAEGKHDHFIRQKPPQPEPGNIAESSARQSDTVKLYGEIRIKKGSSFLQRYEAFQAKNVTNVQAGERKIITDRDYYHNHDIQYVSFDVPKELMIHLDEGLDKDTPLKKYLDDCIARQLKEQKYNDFFKQTPPQTNTGISMRSDNQPSPPAPGSSTHSGKSERMGYTDSSGSNNDKVTMKGQILIPKTSTESELQNALKVENLRFLQEGGKTRQHNLDTLRKFNIMYFNFDVPKKLISGKTYNTYDTIDLNSKDNKDLKDHLSNCLADVKKCRELIKQLSSYNVSQSDSMLTDRVAFYNKEVQNPTTDFAALKSQIEDDLAAANSPQVNAIKKIIEEYKKGSSTNWLSVGQKEKARMIETALAAVPVEDRGQIFSSDKQSAELTNVRAALAAHRHFGKRGDVYYTDPSRTKIDENKAAATYKNLREQFADIRKQHQKPDSSELQGPSDTPTPGRKR